MKLKVIPNSDEWYADGLQFTCTQCGNCCTGEPGFVWISDEEVSRLADLLQLTPRQVLARYCRKIGQRWSLKERRTPQGNHDCIFLKEIDVEQRREDGQRIVQKKRICEIYSVRPLQCRTWPFWDVNLVDEKHWNRAARRCPGMNTGRKYTREQILALRDAKDWPDRAPTSSD